MFDFGIRYMESTLGYLEGTLGHFEGTLGYLQVISVIISLSICHKAEIACLASLDRLEEMIQIISHFCLAG